MPCQGTLGAVRSKAIAGLDVTDAIVAGALTSEQMARQQNKGARGYERGSVARLDLGDGEAHAFPDSDVLEIPGVARLEAKVVVRKRHVISVVGLPVTLLDGSGAVIDLGTARIGSKRSGR